MKGVFLTGHINIRVTLEERKEIQEQASVSGLSLSEYVRRRILGRRVVSRIKVKMLSELRSQGGRRRKPQNERREKSKSYRAWK